MLAIDLQISLLLTQYMIETNTVFEIIQSAKIGQIHPKLLSPEELLKQFKDIKIGLPSGTDFPVEMDLEETTELLKLSDLAIYYAEGTIVFKISIPLVYQHTMTLYHLIPKPVCENNNCFYVNPNHKYLAVSRSKELYATYDKFDQIYCKNAHRFLLCPEINPLHPRNSRPICEIMLFQDPREVPDSCNVMYVQIATSIFQKLKYKNEWLYVTKGETVFITCDTDKQSTSHALNGVGIFSLNETCKAYANRDILIPGELNYQEEYQDFIPNSTITKDDYPVSNPSHKNIMETKHVRNNEMNDLNSIAHSITQTQEVEDINNIKQTQRKSNYILYATAAIVITTILLFIINCTCSIISKVVRVIQRRKGRESNRVPTHETEFKPFNLQTLNEGVDTVDLKVKRPGTITHPNLV
jgi:hypothetical protein